jgi:hypothetical protein
MTLPRLSALCTHLSFVLQLMLLFPGVSGANPAMTGKAPEVQFSAMDANGDGKVTAEEFFKAYPQMKEAAFVTIDKDRDGGITLEEWRAFTQGHGADMARGEGGMGTPGAGEKGEGGMPPTAAPGPVKTPSGAPDIIMPSGMGK